MSRGEGVGGGGGGVCCFFFSSRRRHTRYWRDWSSDVCSSDLCDFKLARKRGFVPTLKCDGIELFLYVSIYRLEIDMISMRSRFARTQILVRNYAGLPAF